MNKSDRVQISVVVTTKNETSTIVQLLDSLIEQSHKPEEIIIVDANSKDDTVKKIEEWKKSHPSIPLSLIALGNVNRSKGRNAGITHAFTEWVAITDAGCIADKQWLEEITSMIVPESSAEVVGGFYLPITKTVIQRCFAWFTATDPHDLNLKGFLPSSRSIAFTKTVWSKVGSYPEKLTTCEDLVFAKNLRSVTRMVINPRAIVYWHPPKSFGAFFKAIAGYARGDMEARYLPHMQRIHTVWLRYFFFLWVPWIFLFYSIIPLIKFRKRLHRVKKNKYEYYIALPIVQVVADVAVMLGSLRGLLRIRV